jgi:glycosyltransferase involved in cell wall biosynthesis
MPELLVVLLRGSGTQADVRRTTDALKMHTPGVELGSLDRDGWTGEPARDTDGASRPKVQVIAPPNGGEAVADRHVWDFLRTAPEPDLVLLQIGLAVGPGWHLGLRAAAYEDSIIATASAVPAELLAVGDASGDGSGGLAAGSPRGTALGEPLWGCVYVRRDALSIALAARPEPADSQIVTQALLEEALLVPGLVHVLASTVVSAGRDSPTPRSTGFVTPSVRRSLAKLEAEVEPLRVTVDLRCCAYPLSGTQVHALNLVTSLADSKDLRLSVLLPAHLDRSVGPHVDALPASVRRTRAEQPDAPPAQVFHRPYQLLTEDEITDVLSQGTRLVLTHQDMILDRTPAYFPSKAHWRGYTAATALSFVAADEVAFFSEHARREAIRDGLVDPGKTSVVPPGTNHIDGNSGSEVRPAKLRNIPASEEKSFILVLCNSYFHKNRVFALRAAEELRRRHAWEGALVFAGGRPPDGSSAVDEGAFLVRHSELRARFVDLGRVSDEEQRWLYRHAAIVLYPTLYEGFGLIPFEAAAAGTPCVYSSRSSVAEYLPAEGALLDLADVVTTAKRLSAVLERADAGDAIVRAIRLVGKALTWDRAAASYARVYHRSMERPVGLALAAGGEVIVGARSQLAADETERRLLFASRRFGAVRLLARAVFALPPALRRIARRPDGRQR